MCMLCKAVRKQEKIVVQVSSSCMALHFMPLGQLTHTIFQRALYVVKQHDIQ